MQKYQDGFTCTVRFCLRNTRKLNFHRNLLLFGFSPTIHVKLRQKIRLQTSHSVKLPICIPAELAGSATWSRL